MFREALIERKWHRLSGGKIQQRKSVIWGINERNESVFKRKYPLGHCSEGELRALNSKGTGTEGTLSFPRAKVSKRAVKEAHRNLHAKVNPTNVVCGSGLKFLNGERVSLFLLTRSLGRVYVANILGSLVARIWYVLKYYCFQMKLFNQKSCPIR